jgi:hypothetical protein
MLFNETLIVVYRETILAEAFCADLIQTNYPQVELMGTDPITKMDDTGRERIVGKNVLIYGGYYRENHLDIVTRAKSVTCVVQEDEESKDWIETVRLIHACPCDWTIKTIMQNETGTSTIKKHHIEIGNHLDNYLYKYPSEDDLNFQNGVYTIDGPTDLDKVKQINTMEDIAYCVVRGKEKRKQNDRIARSRFARSILAKKKFGDSTIEVRISEGDSPIVDTCILLAQHSPDGVGILARHDYKLKKTLLSICCLEASGMKASRIAKEWIGGGGSPFMGGGSREGLFFFHEMQ